MSEQEILQEIERLLSIEWYGRAFQLLENLSFVAIVSALRVHICAESNAVIENAKQVLDEQFALPVIDFDTNGAATEALDQWNYAIIGDPDDALLLMRSRVSARRVERDDLRVYEAVHAKVASYWQLALEESQGNAKISVLAEIYRRAWECARDAAAAHPDNTRLQTLQEDAYNKRERVDIEGETMISGAQTGQYVRKLVYIDSLTDDDFVYMPDEFGNLRDYKSRREAREHMENQARIYVRTQLQKYIGEAERLLHDYQPRAALEALLQLRKFIEPVSTGFAPGELGINQTEAALSDLVPNLIGADLHSYLDDLRTWIEKGVSALDRGETRSPAKKRGTG